MENFNMRVKSLREARNVTQKAMGEYLGITVRAYQFYEQGKRFPDFHGLIALADYFDVSIDYLVGRSDDPGRG